MEKPEEIFLPNLLILHPELVYIIKFCDDIIHLIVMKTLIGYKKVHERLNHSDIYFVFCLIHSNKFIFFYFVQFL